MKKNDITFIITTFRSDKIIDECLKDLPLESKKIIIENSGNGELKKKTWTKLSKFRLLFNER